jgi:DNA invertase Pin-like site-specific DNA recombinase
MTPCFAYLRVSGKSQVDGDGFERQERAINAYCAANGIAVKRVYRESFTGTAESMDRPAWVDMMAEIMANGVKTIVIEKLDRLARDQMVQEHIVRDLQSRKITLISVEEPDLCRDDPTRKLLRTIMGAISEYDKTMIVLKLRGARKRKRDRGERCDGAKPYGELPGEAEVLVRARALQGGGVSPAKIAESFNALGIKPRKGDRWHPHVIARILKRVSSASGVKLDT